MSKEVEASTSQVHSSSLSKQSVELEISKSKGLKEAINKGLETLGKIPENSKAQVEFQRRHFHRLIDTLELHDWSDIDGKGVKLVEKIDAQIFMAQITTPVRLVFFGVGAEDIVGARAEFKTITLPSLLEMKLRSIGLYFGPIGKEVQLESKNEKGETVNYGKMPNPIQIFVDKAERIVHLVYI